jgi:hypothetical protein
MSRNTIIVEIDISDKCGSRVSSADKGDQVWTLMDAVIRKIVTLPKQKGKKPYSPIVLDLCPRLRAIEHHPSQAEECCTVVKSSAAQTNCQPPVQHMAVGRCCFTADGGKRGYEELTNPNGTVHLKKRHSWRNSFDLSSCFSHSKTITLSLLQSKMPLWFMRRLQILPAVPSWGATCMEPGLTAVGGRR